MADLRGLLESLVRERVDFLLVGGVAAAIHGSTRLTQDLDLVYSRSPENLNRLTRALTDASARDSGGEAARRAAVRPKDLEAIAELEKILEERGGA